MKIIDPGHEYSLDWLDGPPTEIDDQAGFRHRLNELIFVKRVGDFYPGNDAAHPGTTMQEVLRALCERIKYVDAQQHDLRNELVLKHFRGALLWLEDRAAEKHGRILDPQVWNVDNEIELIQPCPNCLHVGCDETCGKRRDVQ